MKRLHTPSWMNIKPEVFSEDGFAIINTSGGLTSGVMAHLFSSEQAKVEYAFWNTGREHPGTYAFLERLGECVPLRCYEVRKPETYGGAPSTMGFEEVSFSRLNKTGKPFNDFLETIAEFRLVAKGADPIGPNPVKRLCTAYMKAKLADHVAGFMFGAESAFTSCLGLRADEPRRVAKMSAQNTAIKTARAPLNEAGITKCHVEEFWKEQPFTLEIPPHQGNCTLCFLKDEADLADILANEPDPDGNDWEWWKKIDDQFEMRGRGAASYRQIQSEAPMRFSIRDALVQIKPLPDPQDFNRRRFKLIVRQEERILREGRERTPCSCESAGLMTDDFVAESQGCLF